jgi:hypothetical protein
VSSSAFTIHGRERIDTGPAVGQLLGLRDDFARRVAGLAPLPLYLACLTSLEARLRRGHEPDRQLAHLLERTRLDLEAAGRWPEPPVSLDELL